LQYKLYDNSKNSKNNVLKEVLRNRGIEDYQQYLNLSDSVVIPYSNLDNIDKAVDLFLEHYEEKSKIGILVDEDPDGFCSAAMMYLYIKKIDEDYPVTYILHTRAKAHGLSNDISIPNDIKLLIIPDAGTNDTKQCKALLEYGIDVLILDHHEREEDNIYATIVNNQMSENYSNKNFSGAGIVYRFLQALDEEMWNEYADNYLDLCALANISDVMDIRSYETRHLINKGLSNIKNKCFEAFIKAQDYSINGKINIHNIQWYITPVLNGMIRIGSLGEKELLFKAFIEQDEYFEYNKRATKDKPAETIKESIYDRVARLSKNAKSRQDKLKEKSVEKIVEIANGQPKDDKVIMVDVSDVLDNGLTGVVAIKIAEMFNKPCILLNKFLMSKDNKIVYDCTSGKFITSDRKTTIVYGGSARNLDNSPIDSLKDIVNQSKVFNFGKGHPNAFGINLDIDKKEEAINSLNYILSDVEFDATYKVDFILDIDEINIGLIRELNKFEDIIGQGIDEPKIAVENIILTKEMFEIFGKESDTISFTINDVKYIQFKCKEGNRLFDWLNDSWDNKEEITFNIVGKPSVNEYQGIKTMQVIIQDINVIKIESNETEEDDEDLDW